MSYCGLYAIYRFALMLEVRDVRTIILRNYDIKNYSVFVTKRSLKLLIALDGKDYIHNVG